jgi:DNA polymerase III delta prime subunit
MENQSIYTVPWVEKYRPDKFKDIVLDPMNRKIFENILDKNYFPNLLFYGPPGTGKTTTIINLINEYQSRYFKINKGLIIHLNASDERGIDIIRNQIYQFVRTKNLFDVGFKFVILDEVDYMTKNAQSALKYLLQTCPNNVRFCLICNYISKIDDLLQNEFVSIRFNQLPRKDICEFVKDISEKEKLDMTEDLIYKLHDIYRSDIRSIINFIQLNQNSHNFEIASPTSVVLDKEVDVSTSSPNGKICKIQNKIIYSEIIENIHTQFIGSNDSSSKSMTPESIFAYIHDISIQYNIDKKTIMLYYFNWIVRNHPEFMNIQYMNLMKDIFHNSDTKPQDILTYFCFRLCELYR